MSRTISYTETLVVEVCWCGMHHAIPAVLSEKAHRDGTTVYCPLGHTWVVRETKEQRLEKELARKTAVLDQTKARVHDLEQTASNLRGQVTKAKNENAKLKKRTDNGVCPHCNRMFANVQRHMASKHPEVCGG
jgi:hypothetical protein